MDQTIGLMDYG